MEPRMNRAVISFPRQQLSPVQEQGIELDYVLPDYYPDICKMVRCFVTPSVVSQSITGDRLSYELRADVRILYCSENSSILQCVTQTMHFSRTAPLPEGEVTSADVLVSADHVNCRAVSQRRIDVRGAIAVRIRSCSTVQQEVLADVYGNGMQLRRIPVRFPAGQLHAGQNILLSEELELGDTRPPVLHVVRWDARPVEQSSRYVSGRLMVQGSLQVDLLYACEVNGEGSLEPMSFRLPYSQLVGMDGLEEQDAVSVQCTVTAFDLKPVADDSGEVRVLRCEAELYISCSAVRMAAESLVCDAFSTEHPCTVQKQELIICGEPVCCTAAESCQVQIDCPDGELRRVYDAWCEVRNVTTEQDADGITVSGMLCCYVLAADSSGMPRLLEQEVPFRHVPAAAADQNAEVIPQVIPAGCSYMLSGSAGVTVKAELCIECTVIPRTQCTVLTGLEVQEEIRDAGNCALKLYYGRAQEEVWEIAKRCRTSVEAIVEENELTGDVLTENGMLLIPIVG